MLGGMGMLQHSRRERHPACTAREPTRSVTPRPQGNIYIILLPWHNNMIIMSALITLLQHYIMQRPSNITRSTAAARRRPASHTRDSSRPALSLTSPATHCCLRVIPGLVPSVLLSDLSVLKGHEDHAHKHHYPAAWQRDNSHPLPHDCQATTDMTHWYRESLKRLPQHGHEGQINIYPIAVTALRSRDLGSGQSRVRSNSAPNQFSVATRTQEPIVFLPRLSSSYSRSSRERSRSSQFLSPQQPRATTLLRESDAAAGPDMHTQ
jgi:hypothetical protein